MHRDVYRDHWRRGKDTVNIEILSYRNFIERSELLEPSTPMYTIHTLKLLITSHS